MDLLDLLQAVMNTCATAALSGIVVYRVQLGLHQKAARDREKYKAERQKKLESFKSAQSAEMSRLSLLHEKWATGIPPLFAKLRRVMDKVGNLLSPLSAEGGPSQA